MRGGFEGEPTATLRFGHARVQLACCRGPEQVRPSAYPHHHEAQRRAGGRAQRGVEAREGRLAVHAGQRRPAREGLPAARRGLHRGQYTTVQYSQSIQSVQCSQYNRYSTATPCLGGLTCSASAVRRVVRCDAARGHPPRAFYLTPLLALYSFFVRVFLSAGGRPRGHRPRVHAQLRRGVQRVVLPGGLQHHWHRALEQVPRLRAHVPPPHGCHRR
eukprot:152526-Prorocentrum_minimum.AAC.1